MTLQLPERDFAKGNPMMLPASRSAAAILLWLGFYYSPFLFELTSFVTVHDEFDGHIAENLAAAAFWSGSPDALAGIMGGSTPVWALSKFLFPITVIAYSSFDTLMAFLLVDFIVRFTGGWSVFLLAQRFGAHVIPALLLGAAVSVSLTYTSYGFGLAGMLALWSLHLHGDDSRKWNLARMGLALGVGLNTSFAAAGLFLLVAFAGLLLSISPKPQWIRGFSLLVFYLAGQLAVFSGVLYAQLLSGEVWHRAEFFCDTCSWERAFSLGVWGSGLFSPYTFSLTYHNSLGVFFLIAVITWVVVSLLKVKDNSFHPLLIFTSVGFSLYFISPFIELAQNSSLLQGLPSFNLSRIAIAGLVLFTAAAIVAISLNHHSNKVIALLLSAQLVFAISFTPHWRSVGNLALEQLRINPLSQVGENYYSFVRADDMAKILSVVGESYTLSAGLHPSVASLNGIRALDGYLTMYPVSYKRQFREIIAPVIQDTSDKEYFDNWGSRAYSFVTEANYKKLELKAAYRMGARYIISTFPMNWDELKSVSHLELSQLYLYRIIKGTSSGTTP